MNPLKVSEFLALDVALPENQGGEGRGADNVSLNYGRDVCEANLKGRQIEQTASLEPHE